MVKPRIRSVPEGNSSLGDEAVDLAKSAGLELDEWQAMVLRDSLRQRDGKWAAPSVGLAVARQNGKGAIIEARILAELFLVRSELTIYSAHNFDTSLEHFRRIEFLVEETPELAREIKGAKGGRKYGVTFGHGKEGIELTGDRRLRFRTRTKGGGRGFSCDCLILDEAMFLPEFTQGALLPTLSAKPNPQVWYTGSAVDQLVHEHGVVFARIREQGIKGGEGVAYFEWSVGNGDPEKDHPMHVDRSVLRDKAAWAQANPALGIRILPEYIEKMELGPLGEREFAVERLGIGDWPRTDHVSTVIELAAWDELADVSSKLGETFCLAFDVSPDRRASISAAGKNVDKFWHVEVIEDRAGTGWVAGRLRELAEKHHPLAIVCDGYGPAGSLVSEVEEEGFEVESWNAQEHAQACGQFVDLISGGKLRHLGDQSLRAAIQAAQTRPLGDAFAWSRKNSSGNISPLVSATLALSAAVQQGDREWTMAWA